MKTITIRLHEVELAMLNEILKCRNMGGKADLWLESVVRDEHQRLARKSKKQSLI